MEWQEIELQECDSTFNEARRYPAWSLVCAVKQTNGRGRFNRTWFGEPGGLWVTYNVPIEPERNVPWGLLPLMAGVAIMQALRPYSIAGLRLRWPNDVLVGRCKLAGILVERPSARLGSIGIGLNVHNDIHSLIPRVQDPPARLADLASPCPSVAELRRRLGSAIASVYHRFVEQGYEALAPTLAAAWDGERAVEVITDTGSTHGSFTGITPDGSPILRLPSGSLITIPAIQVNRMKELPPATE